MKRKRAEGTKLVGRMRGATLLALESRFEKTQLYSAYPRVLCGLEKSVRGVRVGLLTAFY